MILRGAAREPILERFPRERTSPLPVCRLPNDSVEQVGELLQADPELEGDWRLENELEKLEEHGEARAVALDNEEEPLVGRVEATEEEVELAGAASSPATPQTPEC